jgi:hypothetical protein
MQSPRRNVTLDGPAEAQRFPHGVSVPDHRGNSPYPATSTPASLPVGPGGRSCPMLDYAALPPVRLDMRGVPRCQNPLISVLLQIASPRECMT